MALDRFSIFLASCKNALTGSPYSSKFDQPRNIQRLVLKLPYNLREKWRRTANDIMELQSRPVDFSDLVAFFDREASIATNPVFGRIFDGFKPPSDQRLSGGKTALKRPENLSFLTQVDGCEYPPSEMVLQQSLQSREARAPSTYPVSSCERRQCLYCNSNHALEDCLPLRWKPYQERILFLASNKLCFGCLSNQHISRFCPQRKTCKIADCSRKHPSILHTSPRETYSRRRCWHRR